MYKILVTLITIALLAGCHTYKREQQACIDGKVYVDIYYEELVDMTGDIVKTEYKIISKSLYLNEEGEFIECIEY